MAKSQKHKKERKADFKKAKLKLGKGKQVAQNATNTSFTSRGIHISKQRFTADTTEEPVSRRKHSLTELLAQTRHYSGNVRQQAVNDIMYLLEHHEFLISRYLLDIINSVVHLIGDESHSVRKQVYSILELIFEQDEELQPLLPTLTLFTLSAMSSLNKEVHIDTLKLLGLLLETFPTRDASILDSLYSALKIGPAATNIDPKLRYQALDCLRLYFEDTVAEKGKYIEKSFQTKQACVNFLAKHGDAPSIGYDERTYPMNSTTYDVLLGDDSSFQEKDDAASSSSATDPLTVLFPCLLATFLDTAPTLFATSAYDVTREERERSVATVLCVFQIIHSLSTSTELTPAQITSLTTLLTHASAYFPYELDGESLLEINILYSSFTALLPVGNVPGNKKTRLMIDNVNDWLNTLLHEDSLDEDEFLLLEPTLWLLLNSSEHSSEVFTSLLYYFSNQRTGISKTKHTAFQFISVLILAQAHPLFVGTFSINPSLATQFNDFLSGVAKYVWELNARKEDYTLDVLSFLQSIALNRAFFELVEWSQLAKKLEFFFAAVHPKTKQVVPGPFSKLPLAVQKRSLDLVYYFDPHAKINVSNTLLDEPQLRNRLLA